MMNIENELIKKVCHEGFIAFIKSQKTLRINGTDVLIDSSKSPWGYCLVTPSYQLENVLIELFSCGQSKIIFNVACQISKPLTDGGVISIDIYAENAQAVLVKNGDSLEFQIDSVYFTEKGK